MQDKTRAMIATMVNAYPVPNGRNIDMLFAAFEIGCKSFNDSVLVETCERFISGEVKRKNRTFCPSVEEFVEEADRVKESQRLRSLPRKITSKPKEEPYRQPTPEEKARVAKLHAQFMRGGNFGASASQGE